MKHFALAALLLGTSSLGFAQTSAPVGQPIKVITERGQNLSVYSQLKVTLGADAAVPGEHTIAVTGAGLRTKKVVINVSVYTMASYLDNAPVNRQDPMATISASKVKVLQAKFLRNISQKEIRDAFVESLDANSIDSNEPAMASLLNQLPAQVSAGTTATFYGYELADGNEAVTIDFSGAKISSKGPNLASQFWSIWFGVPSDNGLATLKSKLIGG